MATRRKKMKICLFVSIEYMNMSDRRSDRWSNTARQHRPRLRSIARQLGLTPITPTWNRWQLLCTLLQAFQRRSGKTRFSKKNPIVVVVVGPPRILDISIGYGGGQWLGLSPCHMIRYDINVIGLNVIQRSDGYMYMEVYMSQDAIRWSFYW